LQSGVAVEKLFLAKFVKIKLRQDAPQTTFSVFLDISFPYPQILDVLRKREFFNSHRRLHKLALFLRRAPRLNECLGDIAPTTG